MLDTLWPALRWPAFYNNESWARPWSGGSWGGVGRGGGQCNIYFLSAESSAAKCGNKRLGLRLRQLATGADGPPSSAQLGRGCWRLVIVTETCGHQSWQQWRSARPAPAPGHLTSGHSRREISIKLLCILLSNLLLIYINYLITNGNCYVVYLRLLIFLKIASKIYWTANDCSGRREKREVNWGRNGEGEGRTMGLSFSLSVEKCPTCDDCDDVTRLGDGGTWHRVTSHILI